MLVRGQSACLLPLRLESRRLPSCAPSRQPPVVGSAFSPLCDTFRRVPHLHRLSRNNDERGVKTFAAPVVAAAAGTAAAGLNIWVQWLLGVGAFVICITGSIFMIAALPTLMAVRRAARRMEIVMLLMEKEMPDTMRAMRLSSLEITDCIEEFTDLSSDVVSGVRASASAVLAADKEARKAARAIAEGVMPAIKASAPAARESLEGSLRDRARLDYTQPIVKKVGRSTAKSVKTARAILKTANLGGKALSLWRVGRGIQKELSRARSVDRGHYKGARKQHTKSASTQKVKDSGENQSTRPQGVV